MSLNCYIILILLYYFSFEKTSCNKTIEVNVNGNKINIFYDEIGTGEHKILMLDGSFGEVKVHQLQSIYDGLEPKGYYTFIQMDLPGFGGSRPPVRDYSPGFFKRDAESAIAFMEALKIDEYSVMGWCYGGAVALHLATIATDRVLKVVEWGSRILVKQPDLDYLYKYSNHGSWRPDVFGMITDRYGIDYFDHVWKGLTDGYEYIYKNHNGFSITADQLQKINIPVLVLHGTDDHYVGEYHPEYVFNNVIKSKYVKISTGTHCNHSLHLNEKFNHIVHEFLTSEFTDNDKIILEI